MLLVPESAEGPLGQHVVVAYDGSRAAKRAMASFAASGLAQSRNIHVASVDDNGEQAWELATAGVNVLVDAGVAAVPHNIVSALSNVEALFAFAKEIKAGLMVMGAFAHSRLAHFFTAPSRAAWSSARRFRFTSSTDRMERACHGSAYLTPSWAVAPFVGYLLLIAALPLFAGRLWELNRNKLILASVAGIPAVAGLVGHPHGVLAQLFLPAATTWPSWRCSARCSRSRAASACAAR